MSRRIFVTDKQIQKARGLWYVEHYDRRQLAATLPLPLQCRAAESFSHLPMPRLDLRGSVDGEYRTWRTMHLFRECAVPGIELPDMVSWYWSTYGWDDFQAQWKALPDPEPLYEIQMDRDTSDREHVMPFLESCPTLPVDNSGTKWDNSAVVPKLARVLARK
jgi:hypothetical protein